MNRTFFVGALVALAVPFFVSDSARAQAGPGLGEIEAVYDIGKPPSTDRRTGRFAITRVAFQRGYPDNPSAAPDKYVVVLYRESGTLAAPSSATATKRARSTIWSSRRRSRPSAA